MGTSPILGCAPAEDAQPKQREPEKPPAPGAKISFEPGDDIELGLRQEHVLSVVVDPAEHQEVNFVLLDGALDATLDHASVVTNDEGRASVTLRGPNKATKFRVRTWIAGGPGDELSVAAVGDGFAPIEIIPLYKGTRPITEWTARIVPRATCADISPLLPAEVPDSIPGFALTNEPLIIKEAPVGPSLAVTVRAGEYAWGCSDARAEIVGETLKVKVDIIDKPIVVGATNLDVTFVMKPNAEAYANLLNTTSAWVIDTFMPLALDPGMVLLDAMAARVPEAQLGAFADARKAGAWDDAATNHLDMQQISLRAALNEWFVTGIAGEPMTFVTGLKAMPKVPGAATLSPIQFGTVPAHEAGMPGAHLASLMLDVGDVMHLGGTVYWLPSRYVGTVMKQQALLGAPAGTTMADALSSVAACDELGQTLIGFDTCDASCLAGLCQEALAARWIDASEISGITGNFGLVNIAAVAATQVDHQAVPTSFQGTWLGSITDGNVVAKISKAELNAELPAVPPPP